MYVDQTKSEGTTLSVDGFIYEFGINLFAEISDALLLATDGTSIHVKAGTYDQSLTIDLSGIYLQAVENVTITQPVVVSGDDVIIEGFIFDQTSLSVDQATNFTLMNNTFNDEDMPIQLGHVHGHIVIKNNTISNAITALSFVNDAVIATDELNIVWNHIQATNVFSFELSGENALMYARFNEISYTEKGAIVSGSQVDMTFNYWGSETLNQADFTGVLDMYLIQNYLSAEDIIDEASYDPTKPLAVIKSKPI